MPLPFILRPRLRHRYDNFTVPPTKDTAPQGRTTLPDTPCNGYGDWLRQLQREVERRRVAR